MGRVWRAADEMLDRQVAVKEMRIDGLDAEDARTRRERTLREARATARIDHPNVVRVYDVVDEGERLWIVMELVKGRSLERMTAEDGPLDPRETALLGLGLVQALRQVHARGVLHRDIKPGNVLVESGDRTGRRIVLTDFGIAAMQDAEALTMVGMLVGSPDYMAPERVSGRPQGPPSDIWSLGATLSAALGGRSPFSRDTTLATLHAVLYEEPELPAAAGPLTDVLTALLEKDPSIRPGLDEVESALREVALPAPTPTLRMEAGEEAQAGEDAQAGEEASGSGAPGTAGAQGTPGDADAPAAEAVAEETGSPDGPGTTAPADTSDTAPRASETPPLPSTRRESPTPAYLGPRVVRAARDPRVPDLPGEADAESAETGPEGARPVAGHAGEAVRRPAGDRAAGEPSDAVPPAGDRVAPEAGEPSDAVPVRGGSADREAAGDTGPDERVAEDADGAEDAGRAEEEDGAEGVGAQPASRSTAGTRTPPAPLAASADHIASASTEAVSEERSEAPSGNSVGAVLRAGATTSSTPLASAPTQDSLTTGAPTEHFPVPDAPTRDNATHAASAPTRVSASGTGK
uniref:serine/threonine-protein kinase n=1 Tax=Streptomyces sp. NRRL B-24085 TaxID=1709476 RepID=UPI000ACDF755